MKNILITLIFTFCSFTTFAQDKTTEALKVLSDNKQFDEIIEQQTHEAVSKSNEPSQNESPVVNVVIHGYHSRTAYFLNDQFIKYSLLNSINPEFIEGMEVFYNPIEIDSVKYVRQVRLTAKNNYFPRAISLTKLKDKYYPGGFDRPVIFMINGNIAHGDYETYEIDENNLSVITLDPPSTEDKTKIDFFSLTTKSEESIKDFMSGDIWKKREGVALGK